MFTTRAIITKRYGKVCTTKCPTVTAAISGGLVLQRKFLRVVHTEIVLTPESAQAVREQGRKRHNFAQTWAGDYPITKQEQKHLQG